jgi:hypothetical protein
MRSGKEFWLQLRMPNVNISIDNTPDTPRLNELSPKNYLPTIL